MKYIKGVPLEIREYIGRRIDEAIKEAGTSYNRVAILIDTVVPDLQRWTSGDAAPSVWQLYRLSLALGKPLEWFVAGCDPDEEEIIKMTAKALKMER